MLSNSHKSWTVEAHLVLNSDGEAGSAQKSLEYTDLNPFIRSAADCLVYFTIVCRY